MQNCNIHNPEDFTFWIFWLDSSPRKDFLPTNLFYCQNPETYSTFYVKTCSVHQIKKTFFKRKKILSFIFILVIVFKMIFNLCCRTWYNYFGKDLLKFPFWFILHIITFWYGSFLISFLIFLKKKSGASQLVMVPAFTCPGTRNQLEKWFGHNLNKDVFHFFQYFCHL